MDFKSLLKKILTDTCVYFTVVTALYSLVVMIVYFDDDRVLLDAVRVMLFFLASFLFAIANGVLRISRIHGGVRVLIHFLLSLFAFCSCMLLPLSLDSRSMIVGIVVFAVLYFVIASIIAAFNSRYKTKLGKVDEYKSQFSK